MIHSRTRQYGLSSVLTLVFVIAMAAGAYFYLSPFRTIQGFTNALEDEDTAAVAAYIDIESIRDSLSNDFAAKLGIEDKGEDGLASLGRDIVSQMLRSLMGSVVSPESMVQVLRDKKRRDHLGLSDDLGKLYSRGSFHSMDQFVLHDDYGRPTMLWERDGLTSWKAVAIRVN